MEGDGEGGGGLFLSCKRGRGWRAKVKGCRVYDGGAVLQVLQVQSVVEGHEV